MALIKSLLAPIRRVVHFPLFQFIVTMAFILWLQAADSNSVFGEVFSALDRLVDFSMNRFAAFFELKSFTRSWLTVGFMMGYVYLAGLMILFLAKLVIRAAVELAARINAFGLRNAHCPRAGNRCVPRMAASREDPTNAYRAGEMGRNVCLASRQQAPLPFAYE